MRYLVLCCDYDGTIAHHGHVDADTLAALKRLRDSGRRLVLVTGRQLNDLKDVFDRFDLFDRVVAENGALLFDPATNSERLLTEVASAALVDKLRSRQVQPLSVGRGIVATWEPHENAVLEAIRNLGLELQVIFNKGAVMVLPAGTNKASGLTAALQELDISPHNAVGVGDAENDHAFLSLCECSAAVENALPALKERADIVLTRDHGSGVSDLIDELVRDDLASRELALQRHEILVGHVQGDRPFGLSPHSVSALIVGTSGGGKSTLASGLIERLNDRGYCYCIIDPEGDYDALESAVIIGSPEHPPELEECLRLIGSSQQNVVVNMLGVAFKERPWLFLKFFNALREVRARTGCPHWLLVDEAHHVLPAEWTPAQDEFPLHLSGILMVSVTPASMSRAALQALTTVLTVGEEPARMIAEFMAAAETSVAELAIGSLPEGRAACWRLDAPERIDIVTLEPTRTQRRRHLRKYAEGDLPEDRSFYFQGPDKKLNLRARNLIGFLDLADGVDDDTWQFHLERNDISKWIRSAIKDDELANSVARVERGGGDPRVSRREMRRVIESTYTLPVTATSSTGADL